MKISDFLLFLPPSFLIFISLDISRSVNETKKDRCIVVGQYSNFYDSSIISFQYFPFFDSC